MKLSEAFARKTYRSRADHNIMDVTVPVGRWVVENIAEHMRDLGFDVTPQQLTKNKTFQQLLVTEYQYSLENAYEHAFEDIMSEHTGLFHDIASEVKSK